MVQNTGNIKAAMIPGSASVLLAPLMKIAPEKTLEFIARHSTGWWLQTEDLPDPDNQVRWENERIVIDYTPNNLEARDRLVSRWTEILKNIDRTADRVVPFGIYPSSHMPLAALGHQCGTCRFGEDAATSVLDLNCRTHDVDNLYIVE